MKQTFTLLALLLGGAAAAQPDTFRMPPSLTSFPAVTTMHVAVGPKAILEQQRTAARARSAATAYRMTGNSRYDHKSQRYIDSNRLEYSGSRGSYFSDEYQNLVAGATWSHSRPNLAVMLPDPGSEPSMEVAIKYDAADRISESIFRMRDGASKYGYAYNAAGQAATMIQSDSGSGGWQAAQAFFYRYDAAGRQVLDSVASVPANEPLRIASYHYDAAGRLDTLTNADWDGSSFLPTYMMVHTYDAAGNTISSTNYFEDENGAFVPGERFEYVYNGASLLTESYMSVFAGGQWLPRTRDSIGYTGSKTLYTYLKNESWNAAAGGWRPLRDWTYILDAQGRWGTEYYRERNAGGSLAPASRMEIVYNAQNLVAGAKGYRYVAAQNSYESTPYEEDRFYYESYQTTGLNSRSGGVELRVFPNPATAQLRLESPAAPIGEVAIINALGQRIVVPVVPAPTQRIDISALPPGVYNLQTRLGDGTGQVLRFVKL